MAIATELLLLTGPPLAADCWPRVSVTAALEKSITAAAVVASTAVAVCHASTELSSPSGRRTIRTRRTRGAQQEVASQQEVEAPVNRRHWRDERRCDNQPDERRERGRW
jgi:hypothetical protein